MKFLYVLIFLLLASCSVKEEWKYNIEIVNPGTRSEGKVGHLYYQNNEVCQINSRLLLPIGMFEFRSGSMPWEDKGWFPIGTQKPEKEGKIYLIDQARWISPNDIASYCSH